VSDAGKYKLTQEVTLQIGDPVVLAAHPELHHYTRYTALESILGTNTLRATHYRQLNDTLEITMLKAALVEALIPRFIKIVADRQDNEKIQRAVAETGGIESAARNAAEGLVGAFYDVSFGRPESFSFAEPYITSFCTHAGRPYEMENGLLSQWRGYGGDGGFCLVFDTVELNRMLGLEFDAHYYVHANLLPVVYADGSQPVDALFPTLLERFVNYFSTVLDRDEPPVLDDAFSPFVAGVSCYKHQGFREECEIRAVLIPGSQEVADRVRAENPDVSLAPLKQFHTDNRGRSCVTVFSDVDAKLPVKRIIVGPSRHQADNIERARALVGSSIPIVASETPFIG